MDEYIENGARLGWMIDPSEKRVYIYRPNSEVEILEKPESVSADPGLKGFTLSLEDVWEQPF